MERLLVNKTELAREVLDCSLPTLAALMAKYQDFPVEVEGANGREYQFDAHRVTAFLKEKRAEEKRRGAEQSELLTQFKLSLDPGGDAETGLTPAQELSLVRATRERRKLEIESGLLLQTSDVRQVLTSALSRLGKFMDALPSQLGRAHNLPEEVTAAMRKRLDEQRTTFVRDLEAMFGDPDAERRDGTNG
jgi:phage terminase Nu1 subunit (DNA packaging protein)